jgi:DTW domain
MICRQRRKPKPGLLRAQLPILHLLFVVESYTVTSIIIIVVSLILTTESSFRIITSSFFMNPKTGSGCMTLRPISTSPITTAYRKRLLLAAFAEANRLDGNYANRAKEEVVEHGRPTSSNDIKMTQEKDPSSMIDNEEYLFLKQVSTLSSSPERLCRVSAMTQCCSVEQINELLHNYTRAAQQLHTIMSDPTITGDTKHQTHCEHRYQYGRQPLVCADCWSYLPICICQKQQQQSQRMNGTVDNSSDADFIFQHVPRLSVPEQQLSALIHFETIDVILWTHHKEWGSPSNTGSVFTVALQQLLFVPNNLNHNNNINEETQQPQPRRDNDVSLRRNHHINGHMLMKGYDDHDRLFNEMIRSRNEHEIVVPVVLWAASETNNTNNDDTTTTTSNEEVNGSNQTSEAQPEPRISKRQFVSVRKLLDEVKVIVESRLNGSPDVTKATIIPDGIEPTAVPNKPSVRLVLIAVEGTWNQAKRMVTKLPHHVRALHLSDIELFEWRTRIPQDGSSSHLGSDIHDENKVDGFEIRQVQAEQIRGAVSILDPLRKQKTLNHFPKISKKSIGISEDAVDDNQDVTTTTTTTGTKKINTNKVCTIEAVVSALIAVQALTIPEGDYIINLADQKVMRTVAYQGKMTLRNLISHW